MIIQNDSTQLTLKNAAGTFNAYFTTASYGLVIQSDASYTTLSDATTQVSGKFIFSQMYGGNAGGNNLAIANSTNGGATSVSNMLFGGGSSVGWKVSLGCNGYNGVGAGFAAGTVIVAGSEFLVNEAGTHPLFAQLVINPGHIDNIHGAGATTDNTVSLYINGACVSSVNYKNWGLWVANADSKFDGIINLKTYTVGMLPSGNLGDTAVVTDANAPVSLASVSGGGAAIVRVLFNGTNWIVN